MVRSFLKKGSLSIFMTRSNVNLSFDCLIFVLDTGSEAERLGCSCLSLLSTRITGIHHHTSSNNNGNFTEHFFFFSSWDSVLGSRDKHYPDFTGFQIWVAEKRQIKIFFVFQCLRLDPGICTWLARMLPPSCFPGLPNLDSNEKFLSASGI